MAADAVAVETTPDMPPNLWWAGLIQGGAAIIIGIFFLTYPGATSATVAFMIGIWWFVTGIINLVSIFMDRTLWGWKLFAGILGIIAGLIVAMGVVRHPLYTTLGLAAIYIFILGFQGVFVGIVALVEAFRGGGWAPGVMGAFSIIIGFLLMFNPLAGAIALPLVFGILGIVLGIVAIVGAFRVKNA